MQKVHKRKTPKVYKNKKLNNANFGTYNLNDYQTLLLLISKLRKVNIDSTYKQDFEIEREHLITAKEFHDAFGVELVSCYRVLKNAGKRLMETSITLEKPELFITQQINVCSKVEYQHKEGAIKIKLTDDILPYLTQVRQKFVLYNLKEVANFGSLYTTRLYELIQEFKDTGWLVKSVAQLREVFAVGKKFKLYADFKNRTFAHAVDEINAQYPTMKLRFEEIKEGRKVVSIDFRFRPSTTTEQYNPVTKQIIQVTQKPKQIQAQQKKTTKKNNDDDTPPTGNKSITQKTTPEQKQEQTKTLGQQVVAKTGNILTQLGVKAVPEVQKNLDERGENPSASETIKAVVKGAFEADKRRIKDAIKLIKCTTTEFYELIKIEILINKLSELDAYRKVSEKYKIQD